MQSEPALSVLASDPLSPHTFIKPSVWIDTMAAPVYKSINSKITFFTNHCVPQITGLPTNLQLRQSVAVFDT